MTTILVSQNNETATWVPKFLQEDLFHFCERGKFKTLKRLHESSQTLLSMRCLLLAVILSVMNPAQI